MQRAEEYVDMQGTAQTARYNTNKAAHLVNIMTESAISRQTQGATQNLRSQGEELEGRQGMERLGGLGVEAKGCSSQC